ncbi:right-handed parallel beta-helix repeat-containing protein [Mangrovibacterium lignilyticum]|uniref:hypothetical protein n=1 Tax=Mangrovibacterium lignilyticum TaxID=2668052 RepID=UPI0013D39F62|nr:hypothetical protein [Mangrovibacterium lignilyticum]
MNRILIILVLLIFQIGSFAQTPNSFNYQAVVRDSRGKVMSNKTVDFSIDIILNGQTKYSEQHNGIDTGDNGIVNFKIGEGSSPSSDFSAIDWGAGSYKIRITMNGELLGISDITAVPIALYAVHSADNPWNYDSSYKTLTYTDGMTEVQDLKIAGSSDLAPEAGLIRFDTQNNDFIGYDGNEWKSLTATSASSGSTNTPWVFNLDSKLLSFTDGMTEVQDLKIAGSSNLTPEAGIIRYDTANNDFIGYNGAEWKSLTEAPSSEITIADTLWTVNAENKSISYTAGLTELKDLKIFGSSDVTPEEGMMRYSSDTKDFVGYNGSEWKSLTTAPTTEVNTPWTYDTNNKSVSFTEGMTEVLNLKISGGSDLGAEAGVIRYDTLKNDFIGYDGSEWKSLTTAPTTEVNTPWTYDTSNKSVSFTEGMTEVLDLKISGSSDLGAEAGVIRYDTLKNDFIGYDGSEWKSLTTATAIDTTENRWVYDSNEKSITYTEGITKVQDIQITGSSDFEAEAGVIRYDTLKNDFIGYDGTEWKSLTTVTITDTTDNYISNESELKAAITNKLTDLVIDSDFNLNETVTIEYKLTLKSLGARKTISTNGNTAFIINATDVSFSDLTFKSTSAGKGVQINSGSSNIRLEALDFIGYAQAIVKNGDISSQLTSNISFNKIHITQSKSASTYGTINLSGNIENLNIDQLIVDESDGVGIKIANGCTGNLNNITVANSRSDAIIIADLNASSSLFGTLSLNNIEIKSASGAGIDISNSSVSATNVRVNKATASGINVTGNGTDTQLPVMLSNVTITETQVSGSYSYGISLKNEAVANISNFYIIGNNTSAVDDQAVGIYAYDSQNFIVNGGIFMKLGKLISVENSN